MLGVCVLVIAGCGGGTPAATSTTPPSAAIRSTHSAASSRPGAASPDPGTETTRPTAVSGEITKTLVIIEENHSLAQMRAGMPHLFSLAQQYGYATDYRAITHPSLPNYLAIAGGSTFGVHDDQPPVAHLITGPSVFDQAIAAGHTARLYAESMPHACDTSSSGSYAVKHAPWTYFIGGRRACATDMVGAGTPSTGPLAADITASRLPTIGMLIPNLDHDAHDGSLAQADAWLRGWLTTILAGPDFTAGRLAVVVTADENDGAAGNQVLTVVLAPGLRHRVVTAPLDHYSLTRFLDHVAGVPPLRSAASATSLTAAFGLRIARQLPTGAAG